MPGISIVPKAATVAGPDPETAPQKSAVITVTIAIPPLMGPTKSIMSLMILSDIFALPMMTPASIKKGMAKSENLDILAKNTGANICAPRSNQ